MTLTPERVKEMLERVDALERVTAEYPGATKIVEIDVTELRALLDVWEAADAYVSAIRGKP